MSRADLLRRDHLAAVEQDVRDRGDAFRRAQRHSRRVRFLRWALPITALGGAAILWFVFYFDPLKLYRNLPIEFGRISITDNKLTIEAPKLSGFTQDRRPYSVTAEEAAQDLGSPNIIELGGIDAKVELANRGETVMRAKKGIFDLKAQNLRLSEGIEITATGGYKVELTDALVEIKQGHILTKNPVKGVFPDGSLQANSLEIFDHGDRARFEGGVVLTFKMPPEENASAPRAQSGAAATAGDKTAEARQ